MHRKFLLSSPPRTPCRSFGIVLKNAAFSFLFETLLHFVFFPHSEKTKFWITPSSLPRFLSTLLFFSTVLLEGSKTFGQNEPP